MPEDEKKRMNIAVELMRKGGTLLKEPCPKCKGVQIKYGGRIFCVNCGEQVEEAVSYEVEAPPTPEYLTAVKRMVEGKVYELTKKLEGEVDVEKQLQLTTLLLKYLEVLEKVSKRK